MVTEFPFQRASDMRMLDLFFKATCDGNDYWSIILNDDLWDRYGIKFKDPMIMTDKIRDRIKNLYDTKGFHFIDVGVMITPWGLSEMKKIGKDLKDLRSLMKNSNN